MTLTTTKLLNSSHSCRSHLTILCRYILSASTRRARILSTVQSSDRITVFVHCLVLSIFAKTTRLRLDFLWRFTKGFRWRS